MSAFDWSTAEPPVWRVLGPEIAAELRRVATMPIDRLRSTPKPIQKFDLPALKIERKGPRRSGRPYGAWHMDSRPSS